MGMNEEKFDIGMTQLLIIFIYAKASIVKKEVGRYTGL